MPVIGRLDGQVEEVLINPVGRRAGAEGGRPARADEPATRPRDDEREPAQEARADEHAPAPHDGEGRAPRPDALPVWLL